MKRMAKFLITLWQRIKNRKVCRINSYAVIMGQCSFEGENKIGAHTKFYRSRLGYGSYMGDNNSFTDAVFGKFCSIGSNIRLVSSSHPVQNVVSTHPAFYSDRYNTLSFVSKPVYSETLRTAAGKCLEVGNDVWIGDNVLIKGGITIGNGAVVAMGAVVTKSIPPYAVVAGVPAKTIRFRFSEEQIRRLEEIAWWDRSLEWLRANAASFIDAAEFLKQNDTRYKNEGL